jgi:UDP-N-acetylglucosamine acyltransferase
MIEVSSKAIIGKNTKIKAFSVVEDDVIIGDNVDIGPSAFIGNGSRISNNVKILHAATISTWPSSLTYMEEESTVEIGEGTIIKAHATVCRGTKHRMKTVIGKNCYIMNHAHVAHDNIIGDNTIITNAVSLGGHVVIGNNTNVGGMAGVHQFVHIGDYCMVESNARVTQDVPPYALAGRLPLRFIGLNSIGLRRKGFTNEQINEIKDAYRIIYYSGLNIGDALKKLKDDMEMTERVKNIYDFISQSERGVIRSS